MFSGETGNDLMPFLFNILNGLENQQSLNPTGFYLSDKNASLNPFESKSNSLNKSGVVGVIQIHHPIFKYDQNCGPKGTQTILSVLENWKTDESIVGVVLDYNSGGGQVSGTREIAHYIFNYDKPIVSYSNDVVGSAAYYMYAAGNFKILNEFADFIGSVGVMTQGVNLKGVVEKKGGKVYEVYSDLSSEKNNATRELQEGNERPLIEKVLNPLAKTFIEDVKMFVPGISEKVLKGDVFSPSEALQEGMIDAFGTFENAINKVFELAAAKNNNNNMSTNQSKNNMSKNLPTLEACLGLETPLESNDNGTFLNEQQLDQLETSLETLQATNAGLQTQIAEAATANETSVLDVKAKLAEATGSLTTIETSVNATLTNAGLPVDGTITEKLGALQTYASLKGALDGAPPTILKKDSSADANTNFVDVTAAHNQIANSLKK